MPSLKYVGAEYTEDGNPNDVVSEGDADSQFESASVNQTAVQSAIASAVSTMASSTYVNTGLEGYIELPYLQNAEQSLIPTANIGTAGGPCPLVDGAIPSQYIPSLGTGYVLGPFGATATYPQTGVGSVPAKIADWGLGPTGWSTQPMVFMSLLVSGINGARPVVDVLISPGEPTSYSSRGTTLIARGVGRDTWNDAQAITVEAVPGALSQIGGSTGYSPAYNVWISAWVYDVNGQGVSVVTNNIATAGVWFWRYQR